MYTRSSSLIEIDIANVSFAQEMLNALLNEGYVDWLGRQKTSPIYFKDVMYKIRVHGKKHKIRLKNFDLKKENNKYRVIGYRGSEDILGVGYFTIVQRVLGNMQQVDGNWVFRAFSGRRKPLVARIYKHAALYQKGYSETEINVKVQNENKILHHLDQSLKDSVASAIHPESGGKISYIMAREVEGEDLFSLLQTTERTARRLSASKKLIISINLVQAVLRKHQQDVCHRDVKTNNFIVNPNSGAVELIDFNSAKLNSIHAPGKYDVSWRYAAPETLSRENIADERSDIFSTGLTLLMLWGGVGRASRNAPISFDRLFAGMEEISDEDKKQIQAIISRMLSNDRGERGTLEEARDAFVQLELHDKPHNIQVAHQIAERIQMQLLAIEDERADGDPAQVILTNIEGLVDEPEAVRKFIQTLGIKAFSELTSKTEVVEKAVAIMQTFNANWQALQKWHEKINQLATYTDCLLPNEKVLIQDLVVKVNALRNKRNKRRIKLDDFVELNACISTRLPSLGCAVADFETSTSITTRATLWRNWCELSKRMCYDLLFLNLKSVERENLERWQREMNRIKLENCVSSTASIARLLNTYQKVYAQYQADRKPNLKVKIYPRKLIPDTAYLLNQLTKQYSGQLEFEGEYDIFVPDIKNPKKQLKVKIALMQPIKGRYHGAMLHFDVLETARLGSGATANVYANEYTLVPYKEGMRAKPKTNIYKIFRSPNLMGMTAEAAQRVNQVWLEDMQNEACALKLDPDFHAKDLVVYADNEGNLLGGHQVMRRFTGVPLNKLIDSGNLPAADDCLKIFTNLALDLHRMHHYFNLAHRDIKLENIILKPDGKVKVVDFGHVIRDGQDDHKPRGTLTTVAIEDFFGEMLDQRSDIYSTAIVMIEMLTGRRDNARIKRILEERNKRMLEERNKGHIRMDLLPSEHDRLLNYAAKLRDILTTEGELIKLHENEIVIHGFNVDEIKALKNLTHKMMLRDKMSRPQWRQIISELRLLQLNREIKREKVPDTVARQMRDVHELAVRVHAELTLAAFGRSDQPLTDLQRIIDGAIEDLGSTLPPAALRTFLRVIDVIVFKNVTSIEMLQQRAHAIITAYHHNLDEIKNLNRHFEKYSASIAATPPHIENYQAINQHVQTQLARVKTLLAKYSRAKQRSFTYDELNEFNQHFAAELAQLKEARQKLKKTPSFIILTTHTQILTKLRTAHQQRDTKKKAARLKDALRKAVAEYKIYVDFEVRPDPIRAERYRNMHAVLKVIDDTEIKNSKQLRAAVDSVLAQMNSKTLGFFGHSVFYKKIHAAAHGRYTADPALQDRVWRLLK